MTPFPVDVVIAGGGTGGHIYPGLAVAEALAVRRPGIRIAFIGTRRGLESDIVPRAGYPLFTIPARGLARRVSLALVGSLWQAGAGVVAAWRLLGRMRPRVVLGTGGYAAAPVIAAALLRRLPVVVQEQNAYPGLTNRLLGRFACCIALGSEAARPYFPGGVRVVVTGNPIRAGITAVSREEGIQRLGLDLGRRTVFIVGASQGSRTLNDAVVEGADRLRREEGLQFVLVTGKQQFADVCRRFQERWGAGVVVGDDGRRWDNVWVRAYIDDMGAAYAAADLMVARAGAMSLAEMTARGVPAILVPLPHAAEGHQEKNARAMEQAGAAIMLPDAACRARLIPTLLDVAKDEGRLRAMAVASARMGRPAAAHAVAALVEEHLGPAG